MLTSEQVNKFQLLYKERFGEKISREEAYEQGVGLVNLFKLIHRPVKLRELEQLKIRRRELHAGKINLIKNNGK